MYLGLRADVPVPGRLPLPELPAGQRALTAVRPARGGPIRTPAQGAAPDHPLHHPHAQVAVGAD